MANNFCKILLMKSFLIITFLSTSISIHCQTEFNTLLNNAKEEFERIKDLDREEYDAYDFSILVRNLEKAVEIEPENTETRYFLGYAYSRLNSSDGRVIVNQSTALTVKASEQFEKINELSPKYLGDLISLDPYSKISAEWGTLALKFINEQKKDSAAWAFKEGKKRGGFGNYVLEIHKEVLNTCSKNAILMTSGDMSTFPLYYLQTVEGFRDDVSLVDVTLLNTVWYPNYLSRNNIVSFDISNAELETIDYQEWQEKQITINNFSWLIKPSYQGHLLRGDFVFLSMLKENKFKKDVYFTLGFDSSSDLSLDQHFNSKICVNKVNFTNERNENFSEYKKSISKILKLSKFINLNNPDELSQLEFYRYNIIVKIGDLLEENEKSKAKELLTILDHYASEDSFPFKFEEDVEILEIYRKQL